MTRYRRKARPGGDQKTGFKGSVRHGGAGGNSKELNKPKNAYQQALFRPRPDALCVMSVVATDPPTLAFYRPSAALVAIAEMDDALAFTECVRRMMPDVAIVEGREVSPILNAICEAAEIPLLRVSRKKWVEFFGLTASGQKSLAKVAAFFWPVHRDLLDDERRARAALIARYGNAVVEGRATL